MTSNDDEALTTFDKLVASMASFSIIPISDETKALQDLLDKSEKKEKPKSININNVCIIFFFFWQWCYNTYLFL